MRRHAARRHNGLRVVAGRSQQIGLLGLAGVALPQHLLRGVDGLFRHVPRRGELATHDRDQAIGRHADLVVAFDLQRLAARRRHQRSAARDTAHHVFGLQVGL
ncbi:hypothetical protein D3C73_1196870 [compost metagenome]